jgi:ABC-2 type transport system permease protein
MGVGIETVDVMRRSSERGSLISFYAAGIGVMFLLFSAVGGAGGTLLDEVESGTLEAVVDEARDDGRARGQVAVFTLIGFLQLCVMFLWARIAFQLPLSSPPWFSS